MYSPMGEKKASHLYPTHSFSSPEAEAYASQHPGVGAGGCTTWKKVGAWAPGGERGTGGGTEEEGAVALNHPVGGLLLPELSGVGKG